MKTLRIEPAEQIRSPYPRSGTTLTEVLISLMIMSIGVVSVATLFPLSSLRVLEASRQTNSTITRFSAETVIDIDPGFLHNPDGVDGYNSRFVRGQVYFVDPYGYQTFHRDTSLTARCPAGPNGEDYIGNGTLDAGEDRNGNGTLDLPLPLRDTWGELPTGSTVNVFLPRRYTGATMFSNALRYPANAANSDAAITRARQLVGQPDNWKLISEGQVVGTAGPPNIGTTALDLDNEIDLSAITTGSVVLGGVSQPVRYRAVIFDLDGQQSEIRLLTRVEYLSSLSNTTRIYWGEDLNLNATLDPGEDFNLDGVPDFQPLPAKFTGNIGRVRIEVQDEVYTWALSVRKHNWPNDPAKSPANVEVVVFFKRSFKPEHEYVYPAAMRRYTLGPDGAPGKVGVDDNNSDGDNNPATGFDEVAEIGFPGSDDAPNDVVTVDFSSLPAGSDTPAFRRGGYVCDTKNGLWYRIKAVQNETTTTVDLVLDKFIQRDNTEDLNGNGILDVALGEDANGNNSTQPLPEQGGIYWNPTVVNVFPLEIKEP